jgi:hypothetical protein
MTPARSADDLWGAAFRAFGAAVIGAGIWAGLAGPLGLTVGIVVVAAFVGWLIGSAARSGWRAPRPSAAAPAVTAPAVVRRVAVAAAVVTWLLALVGVYVYSLAVIPGLPGTTGSGIDLGERIRETSIVSFYAQSFGPLDVIDAAVLFVSAWWSAR